MLKFQMTNASRSDPGFWYSSFEFWPFFGHWDFDFSHYFEFYCRPVPSGGIDDA